MVRTSKYKKGYNIKNQKKIYFWNSRKVLNLIPLISPLHISLNSKEILFQTYHFFFKMLYHDLFENKKILFQKPKQTVISLILHLTYHRWKNIYDAVRPVYNHPIYNHII